MTKLILSFSDPADKELVLALARRLNLKVEEQEAEVSIKEDKFWDIISRVENQRNDCQVEAAIEHLASCSEPEIKGFAELLAEKLFMLDKQIFAGERANTETFSADTFLDERAFVISQGKDFYETVINDPAKMPTGSICEQLISIPEVAWKRKTGSRFDYLPSKNYFTYSNPDGWTKTNTLLTSLLDV
ncbi:MAG: DUF4240 domain-containing protein [Bacteroidota bacterium]